MTADQKVQLARWFNARGVRMMKCAGSVESCGHYKAFKALATGKFSERDRLMEQARAELGRRKMYKFEIWLGWDVLALVSDYDELSAGSQFEGRCEDTGVPPGEYIVKKIGVSKLIRSIFGRQP